MKTRAALIVLLLAACSPRAPEKPADPRPTDESRTAPATVATAPLIGLEGLGDLRIGAPVSPGGAWRERGGQASDSCRIVTAPEYPGVYGIVEDGLVRRITVGAGSGVKLAEGIGVGSTLAEVRRWFAGFHWEPHKYEAAPAGYLTAPNAPRGDSALRLEIGADGRVSAIHVGTMPALAYVEGCG